MEGIFKDLTKLPTPDLEVVIASMANKLSGSSTIDDVIRCLYAIRLLISRNGELYNRGKNRQCLIDLEQLEKIVKILDAINAEDISEDIWDYILHCRQNNHQVVLSTAAVTVWIHHLRGRIKAIASGAKQAR